jgi:hypothetical protein
MKKIKIGTKINYNNRDIGTVVKIDHKNNIMLLEFPDKSKTCFNLTSFDDKDILDKE